MPQSDIVETLEMVSKAKTREEKRQILKDRENFATKAILQLNYHPDVKWKIPKGAPPYTPNENQADASLHYEVKKLDYYVDPSPHNLPMLRREAMFVQLLESVHSSEAELLIRAKDRILHKKLMGITRKLCQDAFPGLIAK